MIVPNDRANNLFQGLDASGFREITRERLRAESSEVFGDFSFNPEFKDWVMQRALKPAAVLIPIVKRMDQLTVLLTKRTAHLSSHSGQIAFPGGKIDVADKDATSAALREAHEEIGLEERYVEIIGSMPNYFTGSGYQIRPVIGLIDPDAQMIANPEEVEYIFEVPLSFLMDVGNHLVGSREFNGKLRHFIEMPFGDHYIWGVTAGIIRVMRDQLTGEKTQPLIP